MHLCIFNLDLNAYEDNKGITENCRKSVKIVRTTVILTYHGDGHTVFHKRIFVQTWDFGPEAEGAVIVVFHCIDLQGAVFFTQASQQFCSIFEAVLNIKGIFMIDHIFHVLFVPDSPQT